MMGPLPWLLLIFWVVQSKPIPARDYGYKLLAEATQPIFQEDDLSKLVRSFKSLAASQKAFKGLDGASHTLYQRTHNTDEIDVSVSGRARRSAHRTGAAADALGACELCELVSYPERFDLESVNGTLTGKEILLNVTDAVKLGESSVNVLVFFDEGYRGGLGVDHGGIVEEGAKSSTTGRLLIVVGDSSAAVTNLENVVQVLHDQPRVVKLRGGPEVASVQKGLHDAAGEIVQLVEPILREQSNTTAIHLVGYSLSGGVSAVAASILEGELPLPPSKRRRKKRKKKTSADGDTQSNSRNLQGLCKGRTSAVTIGAPPSFSSNVDSAYLTSIIYGDDVVSRISPESLDRFFSRAKKALKRSGIIGKRLNFMTDTFSLATANLQSHAAGREGEESRLAIGGRAFLVRPRQYGGSCSIHEIGNQLKGGREAIRAAVLWQLNDLLLSKSLWKHHQLESYIQGLDNVHLRGVDDPTDDEQ